MITRFDDEPEFDGPDDPLAVILRPPSAHLGPPPGRYEEIRRAASRRRLVRAAAGAGVTCAVAVLVALPLHLTASSPPTTPTVPLAPPAVRPTAPERPSASPTTAGSRPSRSAAPTTRETAQAPTRRTPSAPSAVRTTPSGSRPSVVPTPSRR
ncbi:hypothetical protein [Streptomyces shenzhenensis]|uniref:hypothetical protein n=1 Tax=Streptomyces shenzhenensis TaxID=943815 RepID=UPI001F17C672|nr:hypothetical protein [Streptomyces shenzhenensis]